MIKNFLKKIYITKEVSSLVNFIGSPWKGRGAILMYHRILPDERINEDLNLGLAVSCSNFENQVKMMKSKYKSCSMDEFLNNLKKDKNEFMLTITFDDGYKDNLIHALPILEKYEVPALIYITTRFLKQHVDLWWFELIETIQNKSALRFNYEKHNFNFILKSQKQKFSTYLALRKIFMKLKIDRQIELLEIITGTKERKNYSKICLSPEEVKILDNHDLITIGSHGHNHLNFKILNDEEIQNDVGKSLEVLENLLNHKIKHFCYPYGGRKEASFREYSIIKKSNLDSAATGRVHSIKHYSPFSLPRIYVGKNVCDKTLKNHLNGFYNLANKFL